MGGKGEVWGKMSFDPRFWGLTKKRMAREGGKRGGGGSRGGAFFKPIRCETVGT